MGEGEQVQIVSQFGMVPTIPPEDIDYSIGNYIRLKKE